MSTQTGKGHPSGMLLQGKPKKVMPILVDTGPNPRRKEPHRTSNCLEVGLSQNPGLSRLAGEDYWFHYLLSFKGLGLAQSVAHPRSVLDCATAERAEDPNIQSRRFDLVFLWFYHAPCLVMTPKKTLISMSSGQVRREGCFRPSPFGLLLVVNRALFLP